MRSRPWSVWAPAALGLVCVPRDDNNRVIQGLPELLAPCLLLGRPFMMHERAPPVASLCQWKSRRWFAQSLDFVLRGVAPSLRAVIYAR